VMQEPVAGLFVGVEQPVAGYVVGRARGHHGKSHGTNRCCEQRCPQTLIACLFWARCVERKAGCSLGHAHRAWPLLIVPLRRRGAADADALRSGWHSERSNCRKLHATCMAAPLTAITGKEETDDQSICILDAQ
jgi:hypothetical protein